MVPPLQLVSLPVCFYTTFCWNQLKPCCVEHLSHQALVLRLHCKFLLLEFKPILHNISAAPAQAQEQAVLSLGCLQSRPFSMANEALYHQEG